MHEKATVSVCAGGAPDGAQHWPPLVTELHLSTTFQHQGFSELLWFPFLNVWKTGQCTGHLKLSWTDGHHGVYGLPDRRTRQGAFRHLSDVTVMPERCTCKSSPCSTDSNINKQTLQRQTGQRSDSQGHRGGRHLGRTQGDLGHRDPFQTKPREVSSPPCPDLRKSVKPDGNQVVPTSMIVIKTTR